MTTWFTADLHIGHRNIITYCNRPFTGVDEMNRALVDNWNEVVAEDDTVWVLGDFAMGKIDESLRYAARLNGYKILVAGNHDRCWFGHGERADGWVDRYLHAGFDEIVQGTTEVEIAGHTVTLCHFPFHGDSHDEDRFDEFRPADEGQWLLHGHVHQTWARNERMINVGVDVADLRPIYIGVIADQLAEMRDSPSPQ